MTHSIERTDSIIAEDFKHRYENTGLDARYYSYTRLNKDKRTGVTKQDTGREFLHRRHRPSGKSPLDPEAVLASLRGFLDGQDPRNRVLLDADEFVLLRLLRHRPVAVNLLLGAHQRPRGAVEIERDPADVGDVSEPVLQKIKRRACVAEPRLSDLGEVFLRKQKTRGERRRTKA